MMSTAVRSLAAALACSLSTLTAAQWGTAHAGFINMIYTTPWPGGPTTATILTDARQMAVNPFNWSVSVVNNVLPAFLPQGIGTAANLELYGMPSLTSDGTMIVFAALTGNGGVTYTSGTRSIVKLLYTGSSDNNNRPTYSPYEQIMCGTSSTYYMGSIAASAQVQSGGLANTGSVNTASSFSFRVTSISLRGPSGGNALLWF